MGFQYVHRYATPVLDVFLKIVNEIPSQVFAGYTNCHNVHQNRCSFAAMLNGTQNIVKLHLMSKPSYMQNKRRQGG